MTKQSIDWISVMERVPDDRRTVLVWGKLSLWRFWSEYLGTSQYNISKHGGCFDCEKSIPMTCIQGSSVSHWAEIVGPPGITEAKN